MSVLFLQTADQVNYRALLDITSKTVKEYCSINGFSYEQFIGLCRGYHPWQATYNRIPLLSRVLNDGYDGWVCYLDADAFIFDLRFDLRTFLETHRRCAFIAAPVSSDAPWWRVNAGVFFINFGHALGKSIVHGLSETFASITDKQLREAVTWDTIRDDQNMLQHTLYSIEGMESVALIDKSDPNAINYSSGTFIRQILRAAGSLTERISRLEMEVNKVLSSSLSVTSESTRAVAIFHEELARALYKTILLREPDPPGLANAISAIRSGKSVESLIVSCFKSPEFQAKHKAFMKRYVNSE